MPFLTTFKTLHTRLNKHDPELQARLEDGESATDVSMQEAHRDLFSDFLRSFSLPLPMLSMLGKTFDDKCKRRSALWNAALSWRFVKASREATFARYFLSIIDSYAEVKAAVAPAPSATVAMHSAGQLAAFFVTSHAALDVDLLVTLNNKLKAQNITAQVRLPAHKDKAGTEKTAMLLSKSGALTLASGSAPTPSASAESNKADEGFLTPETQAWLNTKPVLEVESRIQKCLSTNPPSYNAAVMAVSRCRLPLLVQLLTARNSLGKSEQLKRGRELRNKLQAAMAFAISAHEDNSTTPSTLVQDSRLSLYDQVMPNIMLSAAYGAQKGEFALIDPQKLVASIESQRTRKPYRHKSIPADQMWGDLTINTTAAVSLDNYFHFLGWSSGAFSAFMAKPNAMLLHNQGLPDGHLAVLKEHVTKAVRLGFGLLGNEWLTCLNAGSHLAPFPFNGASLFDPDGPYVRELDYLQSRIDKLDEEDFWSHQRSNKPTDSDTTSQSSLASQNSNLKKEIAGHPLKISLHPVNPS